MCFEGPETRWQYICSTPVHRGEEDAKSAFVVSLSRQISGVCKRRQGADMEDAGVRGSKPRTYNLRNYTGRTRCKLCGKG